MNRRVSFTARSLGTLSLTLRHIELAESTHSFAVITCGPHWGLTPVVPDCDDPCFNWQVWLLLPQRNLQTHLAWRSMLRSSSRVVLPP